MEDIEIEYVPQEVTKKQQPKRSAKEDFTEVAKTTGRLGLNAAQTALGTPGNIA